MPSHKRESGILLHITSLPSAFGIGDFGPESYRFVDLISKNNQRLWSILPLSPTRLNDGNSPYQTSSAFAGNPLLISLEKLVEDGFLSKRFLPDKSKPTNKVIFETVYNQKVLALAQTQIKQEKEYDEFCARNERWLKDYALYVVLRTASGRPWNLWTAALRRREPQVIARKAQAFKEMIEREKFVQFLFFGQWQKLKSYCNQSQVRIAGDMPFYVAYDSADVWVHPELFDLNAKGQSRFVSGVPPDYFSATGQLWGNPVYNWKSMQESGFEWWIDRIRHSLTLYDWLRLDHFRGFVAYWQVPAKDKTAQWGHWVKTPSETFLNKIRDTFPSLPFIAEDLGYIDEPVRQAIVRLQIPGMRVLLFGFDGSEGNPHLVKNHPECSVVYTGTHDTNTAKGWFTNEASAKEKRVLYESLGKKVTISNVSFELVKLALSSKSQRSIIPLQDILGLGSNARMNNPSLPQDNWTWRVTPRQLQNGRFAELSEATVNFRRA